MRFLDALASLELDMPLRGSTIFREILPSWYWVNQTDRKWEINYIRLTVQQDNRTTGQRDNKTMGQWDKKTAEQRNNGTTGQ